jgi:phospholipid/cholesterol/gamma-HCH transport system substrate-binding protein
METRAHYVAVGAFVLAMVVLAFAAVLWLGRAELTTQYARYDIHFEGVTGLTKGAAVNYTGVPIGKVSEIKLDPDKQVRVTIEIENDVEIRTNDRASLETNILSGVSYIEIGGGTKEAPVLTAEVGERYPVIRARRTAIRSVVARAPELVQKAEEALDRLNELLNEKNRQALSDTLENVRIFTGGLAEEKRAIAELIANADKAMGNASTLFQDVDHAVSGPDGLGNKASTAFASIDTLAKNLGETNKLLSAILSDARPGIRNFSQQTLSDIGGMVGDARRLIAELHRLTDQIARNPSQVLFGDRREGYRPR